MKEKKVKQSRKSSIRTKLLVMPIILVLIVVLAIIGNVSKRTNASMRSEMEENTELLLRNVVARLNDNGGYNQEKYQQVIEELANDKDISYAGFIDTDYNYAANSGKDFIGTSMSVDADVVKAIDSNTIIARTVDSQGTEVFDMVYPFSSSGEVVGALKIGFHLDDLNSAVRTNTWGISIVGLISVILITLLLYIVSREMIIIVNSLKGDSEMMANGDFSMDVPEEMQARRDEFGEVARANMRMKESIRSILGDVTNRAELVASHSEELTATSNQSEMTVNELSTVIQEIAESATSQAQDVDNGSIAIDELERVMDINNINIEELNNSTKQVNTLKDEGLELIKDLVDKTDETRNSVREIGVIINNTDSSADNIVKAIEMIRSISEQTNLLALNASIEAARAGEYGQGFAVVAEEIRKLAEESSSFTGEIETIVNDLTSQTLMAVDTMNTVEEIIDLQGDSVNRTDAKFQGISNSIEEVDQVIEQVNRSNQSIADQKERLSELIENLAAVAQENAAGTEEASASVEEQNSVMTEISNASVELAEIAEELNNAVSIFNI